MYLCGYMHVTAHLKLEGTNPPSPPFIWCVSGEVGVCVHTHAHVPPAHVWRSEDNCGSQFSFTMWILGIGFRPQSKRLYMLRHFW